MTTPGTPVVNRIKGFLRMMHRANGRARHH